MWLFYDEILYSLRYIHDNSQQLPLIIQEYTIKEENKTVFLFDITTQAQIVSLYPRQIFQNMLHSSTSWIDALHKYVTAIRVSTQIYPISIFFCATIPKRDRSSYCKLQNSADI